MDTLEAVAEAANDTANGVYLGAVAVVVLLLAAVGVAWIRQKIRSLAEMADPAHNPGLDQTEAMLRRFLGDEVARQERDR